MSFRELKDDQLVLPETDVVECVWTPVQCRADNGGKVDVAKPWHAMWT